MKKILTDENKDFVKLEKLTGKEFAAYSTKKDGAITGYCILTRLVRANPIGGVTVDQFGFVSLTRVGTSPSFVEKSHAESIANASKKREVCVFDTYEEMLTAILAKSF